MLLAMVQNHSTEARLARSPPRSVRAATAGAQKQVGDTIRRLGANVVLVDGEFITVGTGQSATDRTLTADDAAAIAKLSMVTAVAPHQDIEGLSVSAGRYPGNLKPVCGYRRRVSPFRE